MAFGYFTLSDNQYENNTRSSNQFVADITAEALYAEKVGMHSAWIGEHHFNSLGVLSCPDMVLAYVAANTTRLRLAPAVNVLPLHHPIRVAEQGAALDLLSRRALAFALRRRDAEAQIFPFPRFLRGQSGHFRRRPRTRARAVAGGRPHFASRQILFIRRRAHHAAADPAAVADLCRLVLQALDRARGALGLRLDRGAVRGGDELRRPATGRRSLSGNLRQARQDAGPADVQLFHPFRRQQGGRGRGTGAADPLLQGMRDPGAARRSENGAAELSLFHRHGRPAGQGEAGGSDGKFRAARLLGAHHRDLEKGG